MPLPQRRQTIELADPEVTLAPRATTYTAPAPSTDPTATPSSGSTGTGSTASPSDPTTGGDGSGTGALSPQIAPAVVIGLDLVPSLAPPAPTAEEPRLAGADATNARRQRSRFTDQRTKSSPVTSGINL